MYLNTKQAPMNHHHLLNHHYSKMNSYLLKQLIKQLIIPFPERLIGIGILCRTHLTLRCGPDRLGNFLFLGFRVSVSQVGPLIS